MSDSFRPLVGCGYPLFFVENDILFRLTGSRPLSFNGGSMKMMREGG